MSGLPAGDGAQCTSASSPACDAHGFVLRARLNDTIVYERDSFCWALCANRTAYHRVDGVTSGCTEQASAYCSASGRGGLHDAVWSQCDPN